MDIVGFHNNSFVKDKADIIRGCGYNEYGQLGLGDTTNRSVFTKVEGIINVKRVSCGYNFTMLVMEDGTVKGCGLNTSYQLGLGNSTNVYEFTELPNITTAIHVGCGQYHSIILESTGSISLAGSSSWGQLGLGNYYNAPIVLKVPTLQKNIIKYLMKSKKGDIINLSKQDVLEFIEVMDFSNSPSNINKYTKYLEESNKVIKYIE